MLVWPWLIFQKRAYRAYREWTLEQFKSAATYLLAPDEPVLAAATSEASPDERSRMLPHRGWADSPTMVGSFAVVVTSAVVLVLESQRPLEAPRYVAMAARVADIQIQLGRDGLFRFPALFVRRSDRLWTITGIGRVFQPEPVLEAWRRSAGAAQG